MTSTTTEQTEQTKQTDGARAPRTTFAVVLTQDETLTDARRYLNLHGEPTRYFDNAVRFASAQAAHAKAREAGAVGIVMISEGLKPCEATQHTSWLLSKTMWTLPEAGHVYEGETDRHTPVNFRVQRRTNSPYGRDTIDVDQRADVFGTHKGELRPIEISCASWRGDVEQTREFAQALLQACDEAEKREVKNAAA